MQLLAGSTITYDVDTFAIDIVMIKSFTGESIFFNYTSNYQLKDLPKKITSLKYTGKEGNK